MKTVVSIMINLVKMNLPSAKPSKEALLNSLIIMNDLNFLDDEDETNEDLNPKDSGLPTTNASSR